MEKIVDVDLFQMFICRLRTKYRKHIMPEIKQSTHV